MFLLIVYINKNFLKISNVFWQHIFLERNVKLTFFSINFGIENFSMDHLVGLAFLNCLIDFNCLKSYNGSA